jgi:hypothetical protein
MQVSIKSDKNTGCFYVDKYTFSIISRSSLLRIKMFRTKCVEKLEKYISCSITFFRKSCCLWDTTEKIFRARQGTDDNIAHAHCMLDTWRYKHILKICNTYYLLLFHCNNGCTNEPKCFVTRTLPVLFCRVFVYPAVCTYITYLCICFDFSFTH